MTTTETPEQETGVRIAMDRLQRDAAQAAEGPVAIIGGPGSGKSHTLGARIVALLQGGRNPVTITLLTFSSRSASHARYQIKEMTGDREENRRLFIGTFHQFASTFLRQAGAARLGISPHYTVWDHDQAEEAVAALAVAGNGRKIDISRAEIGRMLRWNGLNKARWRETKEPAERGEWYELADLYAREKQLQSTLDLDDLIPMAVQALEDNPDVRATWNSVRTRHLLIDEFQDITPIQYRMAELLTGKTRSITVATDPNQAIHAWRGAAPRLFNQFRADHHDASVHLLRLNHRATRTLAEAAGALTKDEEMTGLTDSYQTPIKQGGPPPVLLKFPGAVAEQHQVVLEMASALKAEGMKWEDMALIYRNHRGANGLDTQLLQRNIPYTKLGETNLGGEGRLRDILQLLCFLSNPLDSNAFSKVASIAGASGQRPLSRDVVHRVKEGSEKTRRNLVEIAEELARMSKPNTRSKLSLEFAVRSWKEMNLELQESGADLALVVYKANALLERNAGGAQGGRVPHEVARLVTQAERSKRMGRETNREHLSRFLESVKIAAYPDHRAEENDDPYAHQQGVTLSTVHSSKGMQWRVVWFIDASQHVIPGRLTKEQNPTAFEEEQRIFYVATTRATEQLYYCNAARAGTNYEARPTEFLDALGDLLEIRDIE